MRISTNTLYQTGTTRLLALQSRQAQLNEQIATGKRVSKPSDDPVASARILELSNAKNINAGYTDTRKTAKTTLETYESNLTSITNVILNAQSSLISAGNASYTNTERKFVGNEIQNALDGLLGLANSQDANGNYLYAGANTDQAAFNSTTAAFEGNNYRQKLQIGIERQMEVSFSGDKVFQQDENGNSNDIFVALRNMVTALNTPITDETSRLAYNTTLADTITKVRSSLDQVLNIRAEVGSKLNEIEVLDNTGADLDFQYTKSISSLEDLDYTEALSELAKQNTLIEAAQKSFVATTSLSLFSMI